MKTPALESLARGGSLSSAVRAEALKSRHAAPVRLAVIMALPFPLLALVNAFVNPQFGVSFSPWNYWYALLLAVMLSLMGACVANADARLKLHPLLSAGASPARSWWAKAIWCLALSFVSNLVVFAIYAAATVVTGEASAAGVATMLAAAIVITITSSWMIPATLFLTARFGMLAGIRVKIGDKHSLHKRYLAITFHDKHQPFHHHSILFTSKRQAAYQVLFPHLAHAIILKPCLKTLSIQAAKNG